MIDKADLSPLGKDVFPVGSHWMCRVFVTTGDWKEVEIVESNVLRRGSIMQRVRFVNAPKVAKFYVDGKYLRHPSQFTKVLDEVPADMSREDWERLLDRRETSS